ncbi:N-acetylmuramic acid 6-phosphate etherase [Jeotgalibaca porci]|uniref:N-acetylmuramic acid 6-phosphate etherase n=1 Tax=Jeotgalibaca porci TaxID=1868793 RepID=UPI0035A023B5
MENINLTHLETEQSNAQSIGIDRSSTEEMLIMMNNEDEKVSKVVREQIPKIAQLIDGVHASLQTGGRLFYIGAGTSGRLGILDASECPPTFGVSYELVQGIIAGGQNAILRAQEGVEDSKEKGQEDLIIHEVTPKDFVIGIAASGRTPYVIGALEYCKKIGVSTGSISCVSEAELSKVADYPVEVVVGSEVITGSTRLKAGTAQKLILNMISTGVMIKLGKVYKNYMVDVSPSNKKLVTRAVGMIKDITGVDEERAHALYEDSHQHVKTAIVMELGKVSYRDATALLDNTNGHVAEALKNMNTE